ncbi:MAG: DUF4407 domain-containing protein [Saprospiraceae bacterium]|nr:DUF4407 domain-containing protein [Saprospiraceae bacterium]
MFKLPIDFIFPVIISIIIGVCIAVIVSTFGNIYLGLAVGAACALVAFSITSQRLMTGIAKFLCRCAGANLSVLENCPGEISKFSSIGLTIILTGLFAAISGGYAIYHVFHDIISTAVFALVWGLTIFNIDRYIVMSIKKTGNFRQEAKTAIPRFCLAIIISFVVVKPLEIRLFQDRLDGKIAEKRMEIQVRNTETAREMTGEKRAQTEKDSAQARVDRSAREAASEPDIPAYMAIKSRANELSNTYERVKAENNPKISECQANINAIKNNPQNIDRYENGKPVFKPEPQDLYDRYVSERDRRKANIREAKQKWDEANKEKEDFLRNYRAEKLIEDRNNRNNLQRKQAELDTANQKSEVQIAEIDTLIKTSYSRNFITQLEMLGELTGNWFDTMWWINLMLTLLFIIIETAPIFVKLISPVGQYEKALEADEVRQEAKVINESNTLMMMDEQINQLKLHAFLSAQQSQSQSIEMAIRNWTTKKQNELDGSEANWNDDDFKKYIEEVANFSRDLTKIVDN